MPHPSQLLFSGWLWPPLIPGKLQLICWHALFGLLPYTKPPRPQIPRETPVFPSPLPLNPPFLFQTLPPVIRSPWDCRSTSFGVLNVPVCRSLPQSSTLSSTIAIQAGLIVSFVDTTAASHRPASNCVAHRLLHTLDHQIIILHCDPQKRNKTIAFSLFSSTLDPPRTEADPRPAPPPPPPPSIDRSRPCRTIVLNTYFTI